MNEIDFQIDSHNIGILTINRPHVHNALNWTAMQAFADAIEQAHEAAATQAAKRILRHSQAHLEGLAMEAERAEFPALWDTEYRREAVRKFLNRGK